MNCPYCGEELQNKVKLRIHLIQKHREITICPYCGKKFTNLIGLRIHVSKMHKKEPCPICGENAKNVFIHFAIRGRTCPKHRAIFLMLRGKII